MSSLRTVRLSEIASIQTGPFGSQLHKRDYVDAGTPIVTVEHLGQRTFTTTNLPKVSQHDTERLVKYTLSAGDVVFSRVGSVDRCSLAAQSNHGWLFSGRCLRVRAKELLADGNFLYYFLTQERIRDYIRAIAVGATMPSINTSIMGEVLVQLPHMAVQRSIAATLGSLDDKIESNRRALLMLDSLLQAHWQRTAANSNHTKLLSDAVSTQYGLTASADTLKRVPKFLRVTDINKENWVTWSDVPSTTVSVAEFAKYGLQKGDLLVARMADPGKCALYDDETIPTVFASYLVRLTPHSYAESLYIYGFLKSSHYSEYAAGAMSGSVQKNMNARVMVAVEMPWPSQCDLDAFASIAGGLRSQINQKVREIATLERLRDTLLPELVSGRFRGPEATEVMHDAINESEGA